MQLIVQNDVDSTNHTLVMIKKIYPQKAIGLFRLYRQIRALNADDFVDVDKGKKTLKKLKPSQSEVIAFSNAELC